MISALTAVWNRVLQALGRFSMYRLVLLSLGTLAAVAFVVSFFGVLAPGPLELVATLAVLSASCYAVDAIAQRVIRLPHRIESSLITAAILLFVLRPSIEVPALLGIALAGAVASLSKYLLAWRGRHIFNPAAFGAAILTISGLGASAWWVGTPYLAGPVVVLGLLVLIRTEKLRVITLFVVVAVAVTVLRLSAQAQAAQFEISTPDLLSLALLQSPVLFLGAFMLSEPLTMPPRRWQQLAVACFVGVLVGWPIDLGPFTLGQERALLIGNLLAFAFAVRGAVRLTLSGRSALSPTVQQLEFTTKRPVRFTPGQYLELDVPHRRPDARGTRREFSIASAPEDLPMLRIAFREGGAKHPSSYKKALAAVTPGGDLAVTGVWGDFLLPHNTGAPVLMVAAGIGVTPFVSQLRRMLLTEEDRDIVLVYVASQASELVFRDDIAAAGIPVVVFTRDEPENLPSNWHWARGVRLDAEGLQRVVPDLSARHAYISGPPGLIAELAPALEKARSLTTDAFAGY
ncbi:MAG TPA: flavodoxin reductase [Microbacterium sp.]|uniref:FAD-dependent oxidoreductase n=1 Tax=Microbacterium sp. TaxID=51671 RepID=UPI002C46E087|nr:flavodoxin reductase [Microbacterium sp.]HWI32368.1 flavodoxin reductase [Microbacterium sp.]